MSAWVLPGLSPAAADLVRQAVAPFAALEQTPADETTLADQVATLRADAAQLRQEGARSCPNNAEIETESAGEPAIEPLSDDLPLWGGAILVEWTESFVQRMAAVDPWPLKAHR